MYGRIGEMENEFAKDRIKLINKLWGKVPPRLKLLIAIFSICIVVVFFIMEVVSKGCELLDKRGKAQPTLPSGKKEGLPTTEHKQGLQNGGFEEGLKYWSFDYSPKPYATPPTVGATNRDIIQYGRTGKCLHIIYNEKQKDSNTVLRYSQTIDGLIPNVKYNLTFYIKGEINSRESFWFHIGDDWEAKERSVYIDGNEKFSDWRKKSGQLIIGDYHKTTLWLISKDICNISIDDITFSKSEE